MEFLGFELKNKNREREKIRKYKKDKYKIFTFAVQKEDYEIYKEFFKMFGGFSKFIKESMDEKGYKKKIDLLKSIHKIKESSLKEYEELEESISDGI